MRHDDTTVKINLHSYINYPGQMSEPEAAAVVQCIKDPIPHDPTKRNL